MDILNWLYSVKNKFARTSVENPDKDLIALGADVSYVKRGDKYQTYVVPFGSAVAELEGNVLRTGIYDNNDGPYSFGVGYPVMTKTTTKVIDTPASPTLLATNLQGWKVSGSVDIDSGNSGDMIYLGSIEYPFFPFWATFPWKTSGQVYTWDDNNSEDVFTPLANGAFVFDNDTYNKVKCDFYITTQFYPTPTGEGMDLYLVYDATAANPTAEVVYTTVSFEFEFLRPEGYDPTFIYY